MLCEEDVGPYASNVIRAQRHAGRTAGISCGNGQGGHWPLPGSRLEKSDDHNLSLDSARLCVYASFFSLEIGKIFICDTDLNISATFGSKKNLEKAFYTLEV